MITVNLLPEERRSRRDRRRGRDAASGTRGFRTVSVGRDPWKRGVWVAGLVVVGGGLTLWLTQRSTAAGLQSRLEAATADSARLADLRAVSDSLAEQRRLVRQRMALIQRLDRNRFAWPHLMDEISRALPELAWLTGLREITPLPDVTVEIRGRAANPLVITDFVRNLQASPYIAEVKIMGTQQEEVEDLAVQGFTLVASYARPEEASGVDSSSPTGS
ncbi:MAG: PilN domain-containing protein [Gemmatimonadota bacterium]